MNRRLKKYFLMAAGMVCVFYGTFLYFHQAFYQFFIRLAVPGYTTCLQADALAARLDTGQAPLLIDVRSRQEYSVSHLPDAVWAGDTALGGISLTQLAKDTPLMLYCTVGVRSDLLGRQLTEAGYTNVQHLYGGIFAWANAGYPLQNHKGRTTNIHPYAPVWRIWLRGRHAVYRPA